jgi:hypothetical protein
MQIVSFTLLPFYPEENARGTRWLGVSVGTNSSGEEASPSRCSEWNAGSSL